ncbi:MAG: JAB domain-containing protein [Sphingomonas sp.]
MLSADRRRVENETSRDVANVLEAHRELLEHSLRDRLLDAPLTASGAQLERYLVATMGDRRTERLRTLFLDGGNRLLSDELVAEGSVRSVPAAARAIINRALELEAAALLLVHNHPGGHTEPSPADIAFTRAIAEVGRHLAITVHDHLIVAGSICTSLRARGAAGMTDAARITAAARELYQARRSRKQYFETLGCAFGEPMWDLMLELFVAQREQRRVSLSKACISANVPVTTAIDGWR